MVMPRQFLGLTSTKQRIECPAQGQNAVPPVSLKLATLRPPVYHSTTEPMCSIKMSHPMTKITQWHVLPVTHTCVDPESFARGGPTCCDFSGGPDQSC